MNGGLNLSELDGWWAEAYSAEVGWALGDGREHPEPEWDATEAEALYQLLEQEIIPAFTRDTHDNLGSTPLFHDGRSRSVLVDLPPAFRLGVALGIHNTISSNIASTIGKEDDTMVVQSFGIRQFTLAGVMGIALLGGWAGRGVAQEQEVAAAGKPVYDHNCAVCHGREGKGDGGAANVLTVKPADLTQISQRNGGNFPFWRVYGVIDGREEVKGHGSRDMPIWGDVFRMDAPSSPTAQSQARGRILELVYYLQSIQAK